MKDKGIVFLDPPRDCFDEDTTQSALILGNPVFLRGKRLANLPKCATSGLLFLHLCPTLKAASLQLTSTLDPCARYGIICDSP